MRLTLYFNILVWVAIGVQGLRVRNCYHPEGSNSEANRMNAFELSILAIASVDRDIKRKISCDVNDSGAIRKP